MYLVRLIYASKKTQDIGPQDIEQILKSARANNQELDVTGMLCFNRKFFLQCLEGSRKKVNHIYHKILNDPRHSDIVMLDYQEISKREFSAWSMGYMPESSLTRPVLLKFSGSGDFNPYEISGESAHGLMLALRENVPLV